MKTALAGLLLAAAALAADSGIKPRAAVAEYQFHEAAAALDIGAAVLSPREVRSSFSSDLNRAYLVVEVSIYPKGELRLNTDDFALRAGGSGEWLRPVSARVTAAGLQRDSSRGRDVDIYPSVSVGYGSGGYGRGGWGTAGVGVGVGPSRPASTPDDRGTMETELSDKALPEGATSQPVAGYLYFPLPKGRNITLDLEFQGTDLVTLPVGIYHK